MLPSRLLLAGQDTRGLSSGGPSPWQRIGVGIRVVSGVIKRTDDAGIFVLPHYRHTQLAPLHHRLRMVRRAAKVGDVLWCVLRMHPDVWRGGAQFA
jgi:hypothetical protein